MDHRLALNLIGSLGWDQIPSVMEPHAPFKSVKRQNWDPLGAILEHLLWAIRIHVFSLGGSPHLGWNKCFVLSLGVPCLDSSD